MGRTLFASRSEKTDTEHTLDWCCKMDQSTEKSKVAKSAWKASRLKTDGCDHLGQSINGAIT